MLDGCLPFGFGTVSAKPLASLPIWLSSVNTCTQLLGRLFKIQAPKIKVAVLAINESIVQNQLEQRQIDFALVTPDFQAPDIHAKNLYDERYICAVRHDHPIAQQIELTLEQFCQLEQALIFYNGGRFSGVTDQALKAMGLQRNVSLSVIGTRNFPLWSVNSV